MLDNDAFYSYTNSTTDQSSSNFHRFAIYFVHMLRYTKFSQVCYFVHNVKIHQEVRRLVLDTLLPTEVSSAWIAFVSVAEIGIKKCWAIFYAMTMWLFPLPLLLAHLVELLMAPLFLTSVSSLSPLCF